VAGRSFYFVFVKFLLFRYVTGKRGRGRKLLLEDLKEKRGYWKLKEKHHWIALCGELAFEEAMDPVVIQTT
jgi:hypothetical protein